MIASGRLELWLAFVFSEEKRGAKIGGSGIWKQKQKAPKVWKQKETIIEKFGVVSSFAWDSAVLFTVDEFGVSASC